MKKIIFVLFVMISFVLISSTVFAGGGLGKRVLNGFVKVYTAKAEEREEIRRQEREASAQNQRDLERNRAQILMDIERNRAQILMDQERAEAMERQERKLRNNQQTYTQQAEVVSPVQVSDVGVNPGDVLITIHLYPNHTCQIDGRNEIFQNTQELKDFTDFVYPNQTVRVKVVKH